MGMTMTIKNKKMTTITISMFGVMLVTVLGLSTFGIFENAYAGHPDCTTASGDHCYSVLRKNGFYDGNKASITGQDLFISCSDANPNLAATPLWTRFPNGDWLETGMITGRIAGTCQGDMIYSYSKILGVGAWGQHGSYTNGITYVMSIDDASSNVIWNIKKNGSTLRSIGTTYTNAQSEVGAEVTDDVATVPKTKFNNIQYYSGSTQTSWTTDITNFANHPPLSKTICNNYYNINFGTDTLTC